MCCCCVHWLNGVHWPSHNIHISRSFVWALVQCIDRDTGSDSIEDMDDSRGNRMHFRFFIIFYFLLSTWFAHLSSFICFFLVLLHCIVFPLLVSLSLSYFDISLQIIPTTRWTITVGLGWIHHTPPYKSNKTTIKTTTTTTTKIFFCEQSGKK